jgi:hypothetical protein
VLRYLLDENQRGDLWRLIQHHNLADELPIDAIRVGDAADLPLKSLDPEILRWAEGHDRILVTNDRGTIPDHFRQHLANGHHSPGVFVIRPLRPYSEVVDFLVLAAYESEPEEWQDQIEFIPW